MTDQAPTLLQFPIRLKCSSLEAALEEPGLEEALARALARAFALARSKLPVEVVIGGGVWLQAPNLDGASMDGERSRRLLACVQRAIDLAARSASLPLTANPAPSGADHAQPSNDFDRLREAFDLARYDAKHSAYILDSYNGGTAPASIVTFENDEIYAHSVEVVKLIIGSAALDPEVQAELFLLSAKASVGNPLGVIFREQTDQGRHWGVAVTTGSQTEISAFTFRAFAKEIFRGPKAIPRFKTVDVTPSPGPATAEVVIDSVDPATLKAKLMEMQRERFNGIAARTPTPPKITTPKFREQLEADFEKLIDRDVAEVLRHGSAAAVKVKMSGEDVLVWLPSKMTTPWRSAKLTPIVAYVKGKKEKKTGRTGGSPLGKAPGGSPGGDETGGGAPGGSADGVRGGAGLCPPDIRPENHPPDDIEESEKNLPFLGEPALSEIGDAGVRLGKKMDVLAAALGIAAGDYAGQFCYHAAAALVKAANATQAMTETAVGENAPARGEKGNMGALHFKPNGSPIIQRIRTLAASIYDLDKLINEVIDIFEGDPYRCSIHGIWRGRGVSWALRLLEAVAPVVREAASALFVGACRSTLLQLLATSRQELLKRQNAMPRYAQLFERWIVPLIADEAELQSMRSMLTRDRIAKITAKAGPVIAVAAPQAAWVSASASLLIALRGTPILRGQGALYEIVEDEKGVPRIRDAQGVLWSNDDLERALSFKGQIAEGVDPLVKQIVDTQEARDRFKGATAVADELAALLDEMLQNNAEMAKKAAGDKTFAFTSSPIEEQIPAATVSGSKYALQGVHLIAHEQIGDAFRGSSYYAGGIDDLFDSEEGKKALLGAGLMVGLVLISVLVPGGAVIAMAVGGVMGAHELDKAYEKKRLYRALIDPDLVLRYADVEAELFAAWIGAAIAVIPEAGPATKALLAGGKQVLKGEAKAVAKTAGKAIAKRVVAELAEYAAKDLLEAFVKEAVINVVMDQIMQRALGPLIEHVSKEAAIGHGGGDAAPGVASDMLMTPEEQEFFDMLASFDE